ncbi:MAG: ATP-binding protein [Kofleriaceae bacterium]|nr:ATP-binding protein [Kofleriaceae bacterium]
MSVATLRLTVPGHLRFRTVAVRFVAEACRLVSGSPIFDDRTGAFHVQHPFDTAFVSAFMEIYNNIALHAYGGSGGGLIELTALVGPTSLALEVRDTGSIFDLTAVPVPALDELPEGGMGLHIARTMLDEMTYHPGPPNLWRLSKRLVLPVSPSDFSQPT